jgi:hypothetical protein
MLKYVLYTELTWCSGLRAWKVIMNAIKYGGINQWVMSSLPLKKRSPHLVSSVENSHCELLESLPSASNTIKRMRWEWRGRLQSTKRLQEDPVTLSLSLAFPLGLISLEGSFSKPEGARVCLQIHLLTYLIKL